MVNLLHFFLQKGHFAAVLIILERTLHYGCLGMSNCGSKTVSATNVMKDQSSGENECVLPAELMKAFLKNNPVTSFYIGEAHGTVEVLNVWYKIQ